MNVLEALLCLMKITTLSAVHKHDLETLQMSIKMRLMVMTKILRKDVKKKKMLTSQSVLTIMLCSMKHQDVRALILTKTLFFLYIVGDTMAQR